MPNPSWRSGSRRLEISASKTVSRESHPALSSEFHRWPARGTDMAPDVSATRCRSTTGLRRFLDLRQQRDWMEGKTVLRDADARAESPELRLKYVARFETLL